MSRFPVVLSAPSGGGKTTIARRLLAARPDLGYSVSCTTRTPREGEQDGVDYQFLSVERFREKVAAGEFAEWAEVHGRYYGTLRSSVDAVLADGRHVVMDIDVQGAAQFVGVYPDAVTVFVIPPTAEELVRRLRGRGSEDMDALRLRLRNALEEMRAISRYRYVVINDVLDEAVARVSSIIDAEAARLDRVHEIEGQVAAFLRRLEQAIQQVN